MHANFGDWLRQVRPQLTNDVVVARAAAVKRVAETLKQEQLLQLGHFVVRDDLPAPVFLGSSLSAADASFPMRDNAAELRILAAAMLEVVMTSDSDMANVVSLAIVCAAAGDLRSVGPVPELLYTAERKLFEQGRELRAPTAPSAVTALDLKKQLADVITALGSFEQAGFAQLAEILPKLNSSILTVAKNTNASMSITARTTDALREQLDIVWWTFGAHLATGRAFSEVPLPELALQVGNELAELTAFVPGPVGVRGYMRAALSTGRRKLSGVALVAAVDAATPEWAAEVAERPATSALEFLCPITTALYRKATAGDGWRDGLDNQLNLKMQQPIDALKLAFQMYSERLLMRMLAD